MNGGNALTAERAGAQITTATATGSDAQLWKITGDATNGYTFTNPVVGDLEYSIRRAVADFKDKPEWEKKIKKVMSLDFSWNKTAKEYIETYNEL